MSFPLPAAVDSCTATKKASGRRTWVAFGLSAVAHATLLVLLSRMAVMVTKQFFVAGTQQVESIEIRLEPPVSPPPVAVKTQIPSHLPPRDRPAPPKPVAAQAEFRRTPGHVLIDNVDMPPVDLGLPEQRIEHQHLFGRRELPAEPPPVATIRHHTGGRAQRMRAIQQLAGHELTPDLSKNDPPEYPPAAVRRKLEGVVVLRLFIDRHGSVRTVSLLQSSGHAVLDQSALSAVQNWKGRPAMRDGHAIDSVEVLPIRFRL